MTNEITAAKVEFKLDLAAAGLNVVEYIPERIVPGVLINSSNPYIVPENITGDYRLKLELVLTVGTATNKQETEKLEDLVQAVIEALPPYAQLQQVAAPYNLQTNNAEYLAVNVGVDLFITI